MDVFVKKKRNKLFKYITGSVILLLNQLGFLEPCQFISDLLSRSKNLYTKLSCPPPFLKLIFLPRFFTFRSEQLHSNQTYFKPKHPSIILKMQQFFFSILPFLHHPIPKKKTPRSTSQSYSSASIFLHTTTLLNKHQLYSPSILASQYINALKSLHINFQKPHCRILQPPSTLEALNMTPTL